MALSKQLELTAFATKVCEGHTFSEQPETIVISAYIKVTKVEALKPISRMYVEISDGKIFISRNYHFGADLSDLAPNHIKQAYLHLKTLPEFADAIDC